MVLIWYSVQFNPLNISRCSSRQNYSFLKNSCRDVASSVSPRWYMEDKLLTLKRKEEKKEAMLRWDHCSHVVVFSTYFYLKYTPLKRLKMNAGQGREV